MSPANWEADKMLDIYIHDYFRKRKFNTTAKTFQAEGQVSGDPVAIDAPDGFLLEWWSFFWDVFTARTKEKHLEAAASYNEHLDPNHASLIKEAAATGRLHSEALRGIPQGMARHFDAQIQNHQLHDKIDGVNSNLNPRAADTEGLLIQIPGTNPGDGNLTLKGWPLQGQDPVRSELFQQPKSIMHSAQSLNQLKLQQQFMLQSQQNFASFTASDLESRRLRMLLNNQHKILGKDVRKTFHDDIAPNEPTMQDFFPDLAHFEYGYSQHLLSSQQSLNSNDRQQPVNNLSNADGCMSKTFQGNDKASKSHIGRKRKHTSLGPASSSGTANNTGQSPASPSISSIYTTGDVTSIQTMHHSSASNKSLLMLHAGGCSGSMSLASNQLGSIDDGMLVVKVDSFLSPNSSETRDRADVLVETNQGFTLTEIQLIRASTSKIECCHFSSDGKLLATAGHDRKAVLWYTDSFSIKSTLEEHSQWITDVRFSPTTPKIATSSADKTVRIWDAENTGVSLRTFTGHATTVTSLDFHPSKEDLVCSSDNNSEIRYWSIKNSSCAGVFKGGATKIRFQPHHGRILAASVENFVSLLDVETQVCRFKLQGHDSIIHSICWDPSGEFLASVSDDLVKLWKVGSGGKGECIHELSCSGNKFHSSVFHPCIPSLLIIGCYESLELWNMKENKTMTLNAHEKLVSGLAATNPTGLVASSSHDKCVKLWK